MKRLVVLLAALGAVLLHALTASAATLYIDPTGSDANPCTSTQPCVTLNRGYRAAQPGDTLYVRPGSYPGQTINVDPTKTSSTDVYVHGVNSAPVFTGMVQIFGSHITFRYLTFAGGWYAKPGSSDLRFYKDSSKILFISDATQVSVEWGDVGGSSSGSDSQITYGSSDILIRGTRFHDVTRPPGSGAHTECLQVGGATRLTIELATFENCATHDLFIRSWGAGSPIRDIVLDGNTFKRTLEGFYVAQLLDDLAPQPSGPFTVTNNTCEQHIHINVTGPLTSTGNVGCQ